MNEVNKVYDASLSKVDACVNGFKFSVGGCHILVIPKGINFVEVFGLDYFLEKLYKSFVSRKHQPGTVVMQQIEIKRKPQFFLEVTKGTLFSSKAYIYGALYAYFEHTNESVLLWSIDDNLQGALNEISGDDAGELLSIIQQHSAASKQE